jgi:predicted tellurium resistance membrane protein TerC
MLEFLLDPNTIIAFLTLAALEIVLGIDNIIFITVLANRLPADMRDRVRRFGLMFAVITRIGLLLSLTWVMGLTEPLTTLGQDISGRDLILFFGGLFLLWKAAKEIYVEVEIPEVEATEKSAPALLAAARTKLFWSSIAQIAILDMVFSLDSVITAVGLVGHLPIMIAAVLASVGVMLWAAKPIGDFVHDHPSIKVLALSFLTVVGVLLIAEAFDTHVPRGYVYFAMAFSLAVEGLNIRAQAKRNKRTSIG